MPEINQIVVYSILQDVCIRHLSLLLMVAQGLNLEAIYIL